MLALLAGAGLATLAACGGPGLPPAGPGPDEIDVGYGTRRSDQVTGAVTSLSEDQVGHVRPVRIEELLRGRVAGLQIIRGAGGRTTYRIRGTNSLQNDREPLFVLDGVPLSSDGVPGALAGLTSQDIRQVDVLKDVSSTSIYGSRGAGGVILITTRR